MHQITGDAASAERVQQAPAVQQEPFAPLGAAVVIAGDAAEEAQALPDGAVRPAAEVAERAATGSASSHTDAAK